MSDMMRKMLDELMGTNRDGKTFSFVFCFILVSCRKKMKSLKLKLKCVSQYRTLQYFSKIYMFWLCKNSMKQTISFKDFYKQASREND